MSRCFPYPPPGYVKNGIRDEALIDSIKVCVQLRAIVFVFVTCIYVIGLCIGCTTNIGQRRICDVSKNDRNSNWVSLRLFVQCY
jgi:hypothetical protein